MKSAQLTHSRNVIWKIVLGSTAAAAAVDTLSQERHHHFTWLIANDQQQSTMPNRSKSSMVWWPRRWHPLHWWCFVHRASPLIRLENSSLNSTGGLGCCVAWITRRVWSHRVTENASCPFWKFNAIDIDRPIALLANCSCLIWSIDNPRNPSSTRPKQNMILISESIWISTRWLIRHSTLWRAGGASTIEWLGRLLIRTTLSKFHQPIASSWVD